MVTPAAIPIRPLWPVLLVFCACGGSPATITHDADPADAAPITTDGQPEAEGVEGILITQPDGARFQGELIHVYDNRNSALPCQQGCDKLVYGIFDPMGFSPIESEDSSLQFVCVDPDDPDYRVETISLPMTVESFAAFRLRQGLSFASLPLDGVWYINEGNEGYHLIENGAGDFAWDLVMLENGARAEDPISEAHCEGTVAACSLDLQLCTGGASNHDYYSWYRCIRSPIVGTLVDATDLNLDLCPGTETNIPNYAYVQSTGGYRVLFSHLAQGSLEAQIGDLLEEGAPIGVIGDSGYSLTPHLHLSMYWHGKDTLENCQGGWSIPARFDGLYVKNPALDGDAEWRSDVIPSRGQLVSNEPFSDNQNSFSAGCF